jgi:beta-galactosidase
VKVLLRLLVLGVGLLAAQPALADRETTILLTGWKFIRRDATLTDPVAGWGTVTLPHTWNAIDGEGGRKAHPEYPDGYYRGPGWYQRTIDAAPSWKGKRVFIRFEAAASVAQVYLNGKLLGEHRGAFTAFCFELTPDLCLNAPNDLRVRVDNTKRDDVSPLTGDFNIDGGIYRPVQLIVTDPVCISPLDCASPGVYLTTSTLNDKIAQVQVRTLISNARQQPAQVSLEITIRDADKKIIHTTVLQAIKSPSEMQRLESFNDAAEELKAGETRELICEPVIDKPRSWSGRNDPYLYSVTVRVSGKGFSDFVTQPLGLRIVSITNEQGFLLNGQPYPIHGVNAHQDRRGKGWAMSNADHDTDMKLMADMGVTAIRLAHYPQSDYVHDLADRNGILLWDEIPLVDALRDSPGFRDNAAQQMREMILQLYNHPSVAFWGMFNEIDARDDHFSDEVLGDLKREQKELDPSRINVAASCNFNCAFDKIPDWICYNPYLGWYQGSIDELSPYIDARYTENGDRRIGLSEYGAGANPAQHEQEPLTRPQPFGPFHPEEWQTFYHERAWAQIRDNPKLWGSFLWCMFDFASSHRDEGGIPGMNDKGLVTADRKIKKDAYFFYQANWSSAPMVHINGRRVIERKTPFADVEVDSNGASVELARNGKSLGLRTPDDLHICRWKSILLQPGNNFITATIPGTNISDTCGWVYTP